MCALHRDSFLAAAALVPKTKPKSRKHHNIDKIQQQTLKETYLSVSPTPVQAVDMHAVQLPLSASHPNPLSCKANCRHLPVQYSPGCSSRRRLYSSSVPHPTQRMTRLTLALSILLSAGATAASPDDPPSPSPPSPPVWPGRFHAMISQVKDEDYGVVDLWYDYAEGRNLNIIQTQGGEEDGPLYDNERANGTTYYYNPAQAKAKYCNVVDFGVGIIRPDWLQDATYLGEEQCGIYQCNKWEQGEIPQAHARFLGLRADVESSFPSQHIAAGKMEGESLLPAIPSAAGRSEIDAEARKLEGVSLRGAEDSARGGGEGDRFITYWSQKGTNRPVKWVFFDDATFEVVRFDEGATMPEEAFQIPAYCFEGEAE